MSSFVVDGIIIDFIAFPMLNWIVLNEIVFVDTFEYKNPALLHGAAISFWNVDLIMRTVDKYPEEPNPCTVLVSCVELTYEEDANP